MPNPALQDGPLARVGAYDLTTATGLALLRRFDAQFHRLPAATRADAVSALEVVLPLAERSDGLLVLPGGALAWRRDEAVLVCDPGSVIVVTQQPASLWDLAFMGLTLGHAEEGLRLGATLPLPAQAATLLPRGADLAPMLPATAEWRGPAVIHWHADGAAVWEMVPAPAPLALAASLCGEPLSPGAVLPRAVWAMEGADERYQLLCSGLGAHLDEVLASEVSDALRFALVAQWTDGGDSQASRLADGLGLLPSAFSAEAAHPAALGPLAGWPGAAARLRPGEALLGIAAAEARGHWDARLRQAFLQAAREGLPLGTRFLAEAGGHEPADLQDLAADRQARAAAPACAALVPMHDATAQAALRQAGHLAMALGVPVLLVVPAWGLCHSLDPAGGSGHGNGAAFGLGAALDLFEED
jgi:hypothetical protein